MKVRVRCKEGDWEEVLPAEFAAAMAEGLHGESGHTSFEYEEATD